MKEISSVAAVGLGGHFHGSILKMILDAGLMVQFILLLLLVFSVVSWAIILMKYRSIKKAKKENKSSADDINVEEGFRIIRKERAVSTALVKNPAAQETKKDLPKNVKKIFGDDEA